MPIFIVVRFANWPIPSVSSVTLVSLLGTYLHRAATDLVIQGTSGHPEIPNPALLEHGRRTCQRTNSQELVVSFFFQIHCPIVSYRSDFPYRSYP